MGRKAAVPLTLQEHRDLGEELRSARARLHELSLLIIDVYGPAHQAAFRFLEAAESLDRLCREMQSQAAEDCPSASLDNLYL